MYRKTLIFFLLSFTGLFAQDWIQQSIDLTINTQFFEAESIIQVQQDKSDSSIASSFYRASVLVSKMTHFENREEEGGFFAAINKVIFLGEKKLAGKIPISVNERAKLLFYLGSAYGYLAFYQERIGEWFSAIKNGKKAHDFLQSVVETDSTLWDAYLGLGSYKYWLSTKIHWLPFVDDERQEGIQLILKTIEHNAASRPLAMHQLIYILLDYGDFNLAEKIGNEIIKEYPQSQFIYWAYSHIFMKKKDFKKAIMAYQKLLLLIEADPDSNPNHRITCLARMMDMYAKSGDCEQALMTIVSIENNIYYSAIRNNEEVERLLEEVNDICR